MPRSRTASPEKSNTALGFEAKLWLTADKLRNNMDAAEYKHVVLGLIFLKYIFRRCGRIQSRERLLGAWANRDSHPRERSAVPYPRHARRCFAAEAAKRWA